MSQVMKVDNVNFDNKSVRFMKCWHVLIPNIVNGFILDIERMQVSNKT